MKCPKCGNSIKENQKFCTNCGISVTKIMEDGYYKRDYIMTWIYTILFIAIPVLIGICVNR